MSENLNFRDDIFETRDTIKIRKMFINFLIGKSSLIQMG